MNNRDTCRVYYLILKRHIYVMKNTIQITIFIFSFLLIACSAQDKAEPNSVSSTEDITQASLNHAFTKDEVTNLIMVTQSYLDGHTVETGQLEEGATLLIFEENFAWALGETSPERLQDKQTRFSWKINAKGQIVLRDIPDDPDMSPSPTTCTLTKTKEYARKFTADGLAEKIDTVFDCDSFPKNASYKQAFLYPLPLFAHMLPGTQTHWSHDPQAISTFQQDRKVKRPDPIRPKQGAFLYDPYENGNYQHSITIDHTNLEHTDAGTTTSIVGKNRLFLFGDQEFKHGTMLNLSYSPVIFTPSGDGGYANQTIDRFELHSVYRIKSLIYNPMTGNYPDRPSDIARSINANQPPLTSALVFKD